MFINNSKESYLNHILAKNNTCLSNNGGAIKIINS